jgi:hypothetical protein
VTLERIWVPHPCGLCKGGIFDSAFPFRRVAASTHPVSFRVNVPRSARRVAHLSTQRICGSPPDLADRVIGAKQADGVRLVRGPVMTQHRTRPMPREGYHKGG